MFLFSRFSNALCEKSYERTTRFFIAIKNLYDLLLSHKDLRSRNFWLWNDGPLNIFHNLLWNAFLLFVVIKPKNRCNVSFNDTCKIHCCFLKYIVVFLFMKINGVSNNRLQITGRQTWCLISLGFLILVVFTAFLPKTLWKNHHFFKWIFEIQFKIYYFAKFYVL